MWCALKLRWVCLRKIQWDGGYGSKAFWKWTRRKSADRKWGAGAGYTFLGFIYNPAVKSELPPSASEPLLSVGLEEGDVVRITGDAVYYGKTEEVPDWVTKHGSSAVLAVTVRSLTSRREDGRNAICSPIHTKYLTCQKVGYSCKCSCFYAVYSKGNCFCIEYP